MHIYYHICAGKNPAVFLPILLFYLPVLFFLFDTTAKTLSFLLVVIFLKLASLKFSSCNLPQVSFWKNIIYCLIMKICVHKYKQSLILFHLFGMMIIFWGLMKITGNADGVLKHSKESMLLSLLLTYWGRKVCILKLALYLWKNLI